MTAFNPGSRLLPAEANAARQRDLKQVIAARGFVSYPEALRLGRDFGQLAIVYGELSREAELIICDRKSEQ